MVAAAGSGWRAVSRLTRRRKVDNDGIRQPALASCRQAAVTLPSWSAGVAERRSGGIVVATIDDHRSLASRDQRITDQLRWRSRPALRR